MTRQSFLTDPSDAVKNLKVSISYLNKSTANQPVPFTSSNDTSSNDTSSNDTSSNDISSNGHFIETVSSNDTSSNDVSSKSTVMKYDQWAIPFCFFLLVK